MKSCMLTCAVAAMLAALVSTSARAAAADYAKKLTMTVSPASVAYSSADAANVPVAVRLSESIAGFRYSDFLEENGGDLLLTDETGNALPHEIETWNPQGESVVWVRVPKFGAGRRFYAYYGGEAVAQNAAAVWSGYTGVWHMSEASGTVADATGNGLDATPAGDNTAQMNAESGPVGESRFLAESGKSYLSIPSYGIDPPDAFSFSGWYRAKSANGWSRLVSRKVERMQQVVVRLVEPRERRSCGRQVLEEAVGGPRWKFRQDRCARRLRRRLGDDCECRRNPRHSRRMGAFHMGVFGL